MHELILEGTLVDNRFNNNLTVVKVRIQISYKLILQGKKNTRSWIEQLSKK